MQLSKHQGKKINTSATELPKLTSREIVGKQFGDSSEIVRRYVRLTFLIPELLKLVDETVLKSNKSGGFKMTIEQAKQELVRRYKYLYENAYFILAPYMYEQTEEEYQKSVDDYIKQFGRSIIDKPSIYLKINRLDSVNSIFEEFLLSDKKLEDTELYKFIESKRNDKEYLEQVKRGIELNDKRNIERCEITKESLDIWKILNATWDYISEQSGDLKNKKSKLRVLDEYYRIARYQNNGKIYKSGRNLTLDESWGGIIVDKKREPFRDKKDIGIKNNPFISVIFSAPYYEDNWSIFTENEKQQIYLQYHDELPCDLEIACELEDEYIQTMIETRLYRP